MTLRPLLTPRETEVLWLMAEGLSNKLIADRLDISDWTVKFHVRNACRKLGTTSRVKAAVDFVLANPGLATSRLAPLALSSPRLLVPS